MSKPKPARYRTTNWSAYNDALRKRGSLLIWLDKEMAWHAPHDGSLGRPAVFSDAAIQFCLSIKVLFKLPLRQTVGMVASLLRLAGLDWPVPDYSTLCRRQKTLKVQIPYRRAGGPLNLLVDSTGIKFLGDGEWQARKHGVQGRRQWRKVHLAMDTATSDIRAVEFTPSREGDSPVLPDLLGQIPEDEDIGTVTADGAYDSRSRGVSDEEVRLIVAEAESSGAMKQAESQMIAGVMRVADRTARGLMTARHEVETLDASSGKAELLQRLHDLSRSRLPVWEGEVDNIIGILTTRDILAPALMNEPFDLRALLREAPVVRDGQSALEVVDRLRTSPAHMVLVYDEYGHFEGIITPMDVLEAIAGEFPDSATDEPKVVTRADGSYLIAGWMPVDEFADLLSFEIDADRDYETVAGLVLDELGHLPEVGQRLELQGWTIEVVDLDGRRIDKLLVSRAG